ncbi:MAG: DUF4143 domain-containing protein [Candidatus Krumholzibacteria bacterium]|nr:DUF4143 domain-containing protein [Candidatus Krumholzibacteria bacterium]
MSVTNIELVTQRSGKVKVNMSRDTGRVNSEAEGGSVGEVDPDASIQCTEQFVGQEILISQQSDIYYWSSEARNSSAEVDYLIVADGKIIPVEVKSGPAGRLRSLHTLLNSFPNCPYGIVFS